MPAVLEANPEIAKQAQEADSGAGLAGPEVESHAEAPQNMTPDQAIKVCPYLGELAAQDPELAEQKAQEYISDPEKMAQTHSDDEDSFWDDLEAEFSKDEATDEEVEDREPEPLEYDPVAEAEAITRLSDEENAAAQEEIQNRRFSRNKSSARRKHVKSKEGSVHAIDTDGIVRIVIAANPQACEDYRNGDTEALGILVNEAMELSKASK